MVPQHSSKPDDIESSGEAESDERNFLRRLSSDEATDLENRSNRKHFQRGSVLFRQGDVGDDIFVLRSGRVKICAQRSGREVILAVFDAGALLGELSAVDGSTRSATVVALDDVEVDVISHPEFMQLLDEHPRIATELLRLVAGRLRDASLRQIEFGTMDTLSRLCSSLTQLATRYGVERDGEIVLDTPFHQGELASWSGMSREAVVKGFRQLRGLGWLRVDGRTITLRNPNAIRRRAAGR